MLRVQACRLPRRRPRWRPSSRSNLAGKSESPDYSAASLRSLLQSLWRAGRAACEQVRSLVNMQFDGIKVSNWLTVNRVNSKVTLKVSLDNLLPLIPQVIHPQLQSSRYVAQRTNTLVIQSEESRKQAANVETCFDKLHQLLRATANEAIPGETSQGQREKVQKLYVLYPLCIIDGFVHV